METEEIKFVKDSFGDNVVKLSDLVSYNPKLRKWCAKITGYEVKMVGKREPEKRVFFKREFLPRSKIPDGGIGIDVSTVKPGDILEAHGESWKHSINTYYRVVEIGENSIKLEWLGNDKDLSKVIAALNRQA